MPPIPVLDLKAYAVALAARFENPGIAHETFQIAMDGSEKMPQRIFAAVADARARGVDIRPFAFATAAWSRHVSMATHDCAPYELRDPRALNLRDMAEGREADEIVTALRGASFIPGALSADIGFWTTVEGILAEMLFEPMRDVIAREAK